MAQQFCFEINWPLVPVKSTVEISQNFVAFSEYMNFLEYVNFICFDELV